MVMMTMRFDAWRVEGKWLPDYGKLRRQFALERFDFALEGEREGFLMNHLVIGHKFFGTWLKDAKMGKAALVSGFTPSGTPHIGTLCIFKQMAYYQRRYGVKLYVPIADLESRYIRNTGSTAIKFNTINLLSHLSASGVDLRNAVVYLQSDNAPTLRKTLELASIMNETTLHSIYGRKVGMQEALSGLLMASDILLPLDKGSHSVLVTLGIDEIGYVKFSHKLADTLGIRNFPSVTYTDLVPGITCAKMSKSQKENSIALSENPAAASRKVADSVAGGNNYLYDSLVNWFPEFANEISAATKPKCAGEIVRMLLKRQNEGYIVAKKNARIIASTLFKTS